MKGNNMKKWSLLAVSGMLITTIITSVFTKQPEKMYKKFKKWKTERIHNAYYGIITEKDIGWG